MLTPLATTEQYWGFPQSLRDLYISMRLKPDHCLNEICRIQGPKFVFLHTELVHPPILFDEHGNRLPLPIALENAYGTIESYLKQLQFCQPIIKKWLLSILDQPGDRPVIVVQSDHGPWYDVHPKNDYYQQRMGIVNAYYLPERKPVDFMRA